MKKVCEYQFFDLEPNFEPILTPTFESQFDLSQIFESVFVPILFEPKSIIFHKHTSLMGKVCEHQFFGLDPIFQLILTPTFNPDLI